MTKDDVPEEMTLVKKKKKITLKEPLADITQPSKLKDKMLEATPNFWQFAKAQD